MKSSYYTGIGDKKTPKVILEVMKEFAYMMADSGTILRTGTNSKADKAFRAGCEEWCDDNNVPYREREDVIISEYKNVKLNDGESKEGFSLSTEITKQNHPDYESLTQQQKDDLEVTVTQLFSDNIISDFVLCYGTDNSKGHTSQIIRLANDEITVFNLSEKKRLSGIIKMMKDYYEGI